MSMEGSGDSTELLLASAEFTFDRSDGQTMNMEKRMPRPQNPAKLKQQTRQARYRQRLGQKRKPESNTVDAALAAAVAAFYHLADEGMGTVHDRRTILFVLNDTIDLLNHRGFSRKRSGEFFASSNDPRVQARLR